VRPICLGQSGGDRARVRGSCSRSGALPPSYNVAPTQSVPVVRIQDGERAGVMLRWGLVPYFAKGVPPKYSLSTQRSKRFWTPRKAISPSAASTTAHRSLYDSRERWAQHARRARAPVRRDTAPIARSYRTRSGTGNRRSGLHRRDQPSRLRGSIARGEERRAVTAAYTQSDFAAFALSLTVAK
jgi:hypothetical protein